MNLENYAIFKSTNGNIKTSVSPDKKKKKKDFLKLYFALITDYQMHKLIEENVAVMLSVTDTVVIVIVL